MNDLNSLEKIKAIKSKIQSFIEEGHLKESRKLLDQLDGFLPYDADVCSMRAIVYIMEGSFLEAELLLLEGLKNDSVQFDLLFNLAYINELKEQYQNAADLYYKASTAAVTEDQLQNITKSLERVLLNDCSIEFKTKVKITIFVKAGMDNFLSDIIEELEEDYWIRKIVINNYNQINDGMEWAEICWFEWCDELVAYGSKQHLAKVKKIICRLHSYEAFTDNIYKTDWNQVDKVIFIAEHIRNFVLGKQKLLRPEQTVVIPNGIDMKKFTFNEREPGYNIAYVGYINYKKGLMLLLQTFKALCDKDRRYKLYIAGIFQDEREKLYYNQMIKEFDIEENIVFDGWQNDLNQWMEDKDYILCTSILESQNISVMQAMCKGIKPVIHNFIGAKAIYPEKYVWNTIDEAVNMVLNTNNNSREYSDYIKKEYSLEKEISSIKDLIKETLDENDDEYNLIFQEISDILKKYVEIDYYEYTRSYSHSNNECTISIVTPMYNADHYLEDLFSSISEQTIADSVEWIIVNDCSTDDTLNNCIKLAKSNNVIGSIKIFNFKQNYGASNALKFGFDNSNTDYIAWISADDAYISKDKLETDLKLLKSGEAEYVFSDSYYIGNGIKNVESNCKLVSIDETVLPILCGNDDILKLAYLTYINPINGSSLVFKKEVYENIGGLDAILNNYDGDWDFHSKIIIQRKKIISDGKCCFYRTHENQTSANKFGMLIGSSLTRLRLLNTIESKGFLRDFLNSMEMLGLLNSENLMIRPIFSYFLIKCSGLVKEFHEFLNIVKNRYGENNLEYIYKMSQDLTRSKSYSKFLNNLEE